MTFTSENNDNNEQRQAHSSNQTNSSDATVAASAFLCSIATYYLNFSPIYPILNIAAFVVYGKDPIINFNPKEALKSANDAIKSAKMVNNKVSDMFSQIKEGIDTYVNDQINDMTPQNYRC